MSSIIRTVGEISINPGKLNEFKALAADMISKVRANEPNTLTYEFYFNEDESVCTALEVYKDSNAMMAHMGNVGEMMGPMLELSSITSITMFGNPPAEVRQALEPFSPKYPKHFDGVTR